jgi:hypothetical protein
MDFFNINRILLQIVAVIAAATFMIPVPVLDQPAIAESASAPTVVLQQTSLDGAFQDFADRMALDRRLQRLEQQIQTLSSTAPTKVLQQRPIADPSQYLADRIALDQRLQRLERQIETMQIQIWANIRERAAQSRKETFSKSWVRTKQATTNYRYRARHEIDGTAFAGEPVDANPAARQATTNALGCPASVPCVGRRNARFIAPTAMPEYDEAGARIK